MQKNILLLGKQDVCDYAGVKTLYAFNALTEAGVNAKIYDVDNSGQIPTSIDISIFLPWVESIDKGWAKFIPTLPGRKILYTDNWHWYDHTCGNLNADGVDLDNLFNIVSFASSENVMWWPKQKFEWWGVLVDESIVQSRTPQDYIWIDELWPAEWCDGEFTANDVLDLAVPIIKQKYNVSVMSQTPKSPSDDEESPWTPFKPSWIDELVPERIDHQKLQTAISGARAFITSHHECLGLMQFEAMTSGVPVVTNPRLSKMETFSSGQECFSVWEWDRDLKDEHRHIVNIETASERLIDAVGKALELDRAIIREKSILRFGKEAWLNRTGLLK